MVAPPPLWRCPLQVDGRGNPPVNSVHADLPTGSARAREGGKYAFRPPRLARLETSMAGER